MTKSLEEHMEYLKAYKAMTEEERDVIRAKRHTKALALDEAARKAYTLRCQGHTYEDIAKAMGLRDKKAAWQKVHRHIKRQKVDDQEMLRNILIEGTRQILASSKDAKTKLAAIMNIYKMAGLDQQKIDITTNGDSIMLLKGIDIDKI